MRKPSRQDIEDALDDFGIHGDPMLEWAAFNEYEVNGTLPYAGGFLDQPSYWRRNLATFRWLKMWLDIPDTSTGLPNGLDI